MLLTYLTFGTTPGGRRKVHDTKFENVNMIQRNDKSR